MDCFYAAIEQRENPALAGRPVAVGGGSRRGVVCTCSYEAREFGVRSAMPGFKALELCPHLIFLPVRFDLYRAESDRIKKILHDYTALVEPLSLDEAYLDVTGADRYAWEIAREIRSRIKEETGLTASAGVAPNKMLAKIASDWRKPDGQFAITPDQIEDFVRELPVEKVWGIGPKTSAKFRAAGIFTCGDLQKTSLSELIRQHGKWGEELYHLCRGRDERPVVPGRVRKSLSNERTYPENLGNLAACQQALKELIQELKADLDAKAQSRPLAKAFVKVKFADFTQTTREGLTRDVSEPFYLELLEAAWHRGEGKGVRLLGAGVRFADESRSATTPDQATFEF